MRSLMLVLREWPVSGPAVRLLAGSNYGGFGRTALLGQVRL
ncbi:hypothetical protein R2A130_0911 [Ahrensia sp. R2A130]|nr:hypothetical protein R2A130_0911 [Ahrensia sp. R2A130]